LQALVAVVHMNQARMAVPAVVHLAQMVQMVLTLAVEAEHKLLEEQPVLLQVQPLVLHCKVGARILVVMAVVVVVAVVVIGAAAVELVQILGLRVAAVRDT
jgi:hypothetical protein